MTEPNVRAIATVGKRQIPLTRITVQKQFQMDMPESFREDRSMAYRYSYFANRDKSPLGIAIRFSAVAEQASRDKMIVNYFGGTAGLTDAENADGAEGYRVLYRESVNGGSFLSIYTLRFVIEVDDGLLFGCFNCAAAYQQDWKDAVLKMLHSIRRIAQ